MSTQSIQLGYAVFWKRAAAFSIDAVIVVTLYSAVIYLVNKVLKVPVEYSPILERGLSLKMTQYVKENFLAIAFLSAAVFSGKARARLLKTTSFR